MSVQNNPPPVATPDQEVVPLLRAPSPLYNPSRSRSPSPGWKPAHRPQSSLQFEVGGPSNPAPRQLYAASDMYSNPYADNSYTSPPQSAPPPSQSRYPAYPMTQRSPLPPPPSAPTNRLTKEQNYQRDDSRLPAQNDPYNARRVDPYTPNRQATAASQTLPPPSIASPPRPQRQLEPLAIPNTTRQPEQGRARMNYGRSRTISQPDPYVGQRIDTNPAPMPDPYTIVSPTTGRVRQFPNPNDPYTVSTSNARKPTTGAAQPQFHALKHTLSNASSNEYSTTESSHQSGQRAARQNFTHACVSLHRTDRLRLIKFPHGAVTAVKMAIERSWPRGIQNEGNNLGAAEFQLRGHPWSGQGDESIPSRRMMCEILSALYHQGWMMIAATDISKKAMDKDLLVFREGAIPSPAQFMAVAFNEGDKIRLILAPNEVINAVKNVWGGNVQKESWKETGIAWELKINGMPWVAVGDEGIHIRILLLNMLDALTSLGWDLYASMDMTAGPGGPTRNAGADTDCWILKKNNT